MASVTFAITDATKRRMKKFSWVNWSNVAKEEIETKARLLARLNSPEEQELREWSIALGRKAKKGRWKELLKGLTPEQQKELHDAWKKKSSSTTTSSSQR